MNETEAEKHIKEFLDKTATIEHMQRTLASATKSLVKDLQTQDETLQKLNIESKELFGRERSVFYFRDPHTGEARPYASKETTYREKADLLFTIKNKQYQWLLVEAYELFEDYIVTLYLFIRGEFPKLRLPKDGKCDMESKSLKKNVHLIINQCRTSLPGYREIEKENKIQKNLQLYINMIEKFRHVIVHKNGKTDNVEPLIDLILKRACLFSDKEEAPLAREVVRQYFGKGEYEGWIVLLERNILDFPVTFGINVHDELLNAIRGTAYLITQFLLGYCTENKP